MKYQFQLIVFSAIISFIFSKIPSAPAKSVIEPCSSSDSCTSLLSYLLPYDSKISEIAYRFQLDISDLLAANSITPQVSSELILKSNTLLRIPIWCPCTDGIRRSTSTTYEVRPADTLESISEGFGGLVSAEQIGVANGVAEEKKKKKPLISGESLVIPLPCTCFNNSNNGLPAVYSSYVVRRGESLSAIAEIFGNTVAELQAVNGLTRPVVEDGDILSVPISACSSTNLNWHNESLIVPNASHALTANRCIKCMCGPTDLNLRCLASGIVTSCSHLQCKGSDMFIGDYTYNKYSTNLQPNTTLCNVTACVYRGHYGRKIFRSLVNYSQIHCPSNSYDNSSSSSNSSLPLVILSPSPSPSYPNTDGTGTNDGNNSTLTKQNPNDSHSHGRLLSTQASIFYLLLLLLELLLSFIFCS